MTGAKEQEEDEGSGAREVTDRSNEGAGTTGAAGSGPKPQGSVPDTQLGNNFWGTVIPPGYLIAGRYRVEHFVARGGMGEVYAAHDCVLTDRVALKTVTATASNDAEALNALRAEVTLSRKISHPNVCRMHDIGVHVSPDAPQLTFLTMEYVEGESLGARLLREGPIPEAEAVRLLAGILAGLQAAHEAGVLHRDLKSDNVMLRARGNGECTPVIMDFGLASALSPNSSRVSGEQAMVGSLAYMAPEQVQGDALRVVTDVYSVGVIFFEMLTGQLPFKASSPALAALKRLHEPAPRVRSVDPRISPELDRILAKALQHRPQDRYPSARAMLQELLDYMGMSEREVPGLTLLGAVSSRPSAPPVDYSSDETTLVSGRPRAPRPVTVPIEPPPASEDRSLPVLAATTPPVGSPRARRVRGRVLGAAAASAALVTAFVVWLPRTPSRESPEVTLSIGAGQHGGISVSVSSVEPSMPAPGQRGNVDGTPPADPGAPAAGGSTTQPPHAPGAPSASRAAAARLEAAMPSEVHRLPRGLASASGAARAAAPEPSTSLKQVPAASTSALVTPASPATLHPSAAVSDPSTPGPNAELVYPPGVKRPSILRPSDASGVQ